ncbi:hypothetical protein [Streptomyces sp. AcE210]|uniref:hypothetical protein n=1 Tax=Streptomyces sp. AcE210 TaxID=2292703 RepID=UPI0014045C8A|nr:hypothetical protein [Streptomyces sp. AcE210]
MDRELFNVSKLVSYGYDDAHRKSLRVIARYTSARAKPGATLGDVDTYGTTVC